MIQLFLYFLKILFLGISSVAGITFLILAIVKRKQKKSMYVFSGLMLVFFSLSIYIWNYDLNEAESTRREDLIPAFENNFGIRPPESVKEIKVKNYSMYDAYAHWMGFTYDSLVFTRIIESDSLLKIAEKNTPEFDDAVKELNKNANSPDWLNINGEKVKKIFYKKNFMEHTYSEYYLWIDEESKMVFLAVSYFD